jgi:hypothetical protein
MMIPPLVALLLVVSFFAKVPRGLVLAVVVARRAAGPAGSVEVAPAGGRHATAV